MKRRSTMKMTAYAMAFLVTSAGASLAFAEGDAPPMPCRTIAAACSAAGFVEGEAAKDGANLWVDCVRPIMKGVENKSAAFKIPDVGFRTVAACKAHNPDFGSKGKK